MQGGWWLRCGFQNSSVGTSSAGPFRTGLTVAALAMAMMAIGALLGICNGFKGAFSDVYGAHGIDVVVSRQGPADRLSGVVDAAVISRLA